MKRGIFYSSASSSTSDDEELDLPSMIPRYRTSSSFFEDLYSTLPQGFSRIILTKEATDAFEVSCVSDTEWTRLSEEEELKILREYLPETIEEVYSALNATEIFTAASFRLEEGKILVESLEDFGEGDKWLDRYNFAFTPVLRPWAIKKAMDDYNNVPKLSPEVASCNKSVLPLLKSLQTSTRLWERMGQEEVARKKLFATEILEDSDDEVFRKKEDAEEESEVKQEEKASGESVQESDGEDCLQIHVSDEDRQSIGDSMVEDRVMLRWPAHPAAASKAQVRPLATEKSLPTFSRAATLHMQI